MSAPSIDNALLPVEISRGASGGHEFSVVIVETDSGAEQRVLLNENGRLKLNLSFGSRSPEQGAELVAFWLARRGPTRAFRVKHWRDYQITDELQVLDGSPTFQLIKTYGVGVLAYVRELFLVDETQILPSLERNAAPFAGFTYDDLTGIFTLDADSEFDVDDITQDATPTVTTDGNHDFSIGDFVYFAGLGGMVELNDQVAEVLSTPTGDTFTIDLNTTGFTAYTSGGMVAKYPQPDEEITVTAHFHVPMRFATPVQMMIESDSFVRDWEDVPLVEVRHQPGS